MGSSESPNVTVRPALEAGTLVDGKYRVVSFLGAGGMGTVYRATQLELQRDVALKVIRPELSADAVTMARFRREALAVSRLSTPNVVTTYDFGRADDETLYLVMELLEGESLGRRIKREGALAWEDAARIAGQVARALAAAHSAGVVHRDLKPENIFVCEDATVKVLDFGIARFVSPHINGDDALTDTDTIVGTPRYMSPEAAARAPIGPAADVYALGAILFELVTGQPVFRESHAVLLMGAHLREPAPTLQSVRSDLAVPRALGALIGLMLAKEPELRPSALGVERELTRILRHPGPCEPAVAQTTATRAADMLGEEPARRSRKLLWLLVAPAIVISVMLAFRGVGTSESAAQPIRAVPKLRSHSRQDPPHETPRVAAPPGSIEISWEVEPRDAVIRYDGSALAIPRIRVPRDGADHAFSIDAPGYIGVTRNVVADRDREISIVLRPAPHPNAHRDLDRDEGALIRRF